MPITPEQRRLVDSWLQAPSQRRAFLLAALGGMAAAAHAQTPAPAPAATPAKVKTQARIVIAGAGAAGLTAAARLSAALDGARITGPAVLVEAETSTLVPEGFRAGPNAAGHILIERIAR